LAGKLANLTSKFANFCSPNGLDALLSETDLLGCRGVASDLAQGRMSADRHDDGGGATCFRQTTASRLAQPMRGSAGWQTGCLTFALEPMGKGVRVKWFSSVRHQERQVLGRRSVEDGAQLRVQWDRQRLAGLALTDMQQAVPK
jgi:hypothetical protein